MTITRFLEESCDHGRITCAVVIDTWSNCLYEAVEMAATESRESSETFVRLFRRVCEVKEAFLANVNG